MTIKFTGIMQLAPEKLITTLSLKQVLEIENSKHKPNQQIIEFY